RSSRIKIADRSSDEHFCTLTNLLVDSARATIHLTGLSPRVFTAIMAFDPDAELDLVELYYATEETKYLALALCVLLVCETLITLPTEVRHVWNSAWSFGRIMFHANRIWAPIMLAIYVPSLFMYNLSEEVFSVLVVLHIWLDSDSSYCCDDGHLGVLIARIWAIYQLKLWIMVALSLGCIALGTPSIVLLQMQASATHLMKNPGKSSAVHVTSRVLNQVAPDLISGCPTTINPLAFAPYLPPFFGETILFILTVYKPWKMSRQVMTPLLSQLILQ
ncbi:unnamed protein product, partial [Rhizoctonia solani]